MYIYIYMYVFGVEVHDIYKKDKSYFATPQIANSHQMTSAVRVKNTSQLRTLTSLD
jgi:hypothetical protein